jgi:hypothetical protein
VAVAQTAGGIWTELICIKTGLQLLGERTIIASTGASTSATTTIIIRRAFTGHLGPSPDRPAVRRHRQG